MLPLTGPIALALSFFLLDITVKDAAYAQNEETGIDEQTVRTRVIKGALDPSGGRNLQIAFGGNVSQGDIAILAEAGCPLFMDDNYAEGSRSKQSFIIYGGWNYRVVEIADWVPQTGIKAYRASRHVVQDLI
jgi:hypothetical protein